MQHMLLWFISFLAFNFMTCPDFKPHWQSRFMCISSPRTNETTWKHPFYDYFVGSLRGETRDIPSKLDVGFKDFLFSSLFGEMIQFD